MLLIILKKVMENIIKIICKELEHHIPFTLFGAITGIIILIILFFGNLLSYVSSISENIFYILHPLHIFLSAIATSALYIKYGKKNILLLVIIGYTGAIGIATISDSFIPYLGEILLDLPNRGIHIGFIEEPIITNIPAFLGIIFAYIITTSKIPHSGHVLISTWASLFHIIMALGTTISIFQLIGIFIFLFLAVWLPCCTSDIVYPLLFIKDKKKILENHLH
jgi:hypothetical protein